MTKKGTRAKKIQFCYNFQFAFSGWKLANTCMHKIVVLPWEHVTWMQASANWFKPLSFPPPPPPPPPPPLPSFSLLGLVALVFVRRLAVLLGIFAKSINTSRMSVVGLVMSLPNHGCYIYKSCSLAAWLLWVLEPPPISWKFPFYHIHYLACTWHTISTATSLTNFLGRGRRRFNESHRSFPTCSPHCCHSYLTSEY